MNSRMLSYYHTQQHQKEEFMLAYVTHSLGHFKSLFSRQRTWLIFCSVIFSFMAATEMIGVTSMCRFWLSNKQCYIRLLNFFSFYRILPRKIGGGVESIRFIAKTKR